MSRTIGIALVAVASLLGACQFADATSQEGPVKVEIRKTEAGFGLLRAGEPYEVRGVGLAVEEADTEALMVALAEQGGNSFRTWHVGDGAFLDRAHELGLTVALCLNIKRERHGFDYGDARAVRAQFERAKAKVLKHPDHPALLAWVIGNELNHDYSDPRVYDAVNDIALMIAELDPNHPTTTTTADISVELAQVINERAPALDFISVQVYGALFDLEQKLAAIQFDRPIMVTEWGTIGHWEIPTTDWGAPIELNSSQKADTYRRGYRDVLSRLGGGLIGNYAFLWGQKQERTPTWYGVFVDGHKTEAVDVLTEIWTASDDHPQSPRITDLTLAGKRAGDNVRLVAGSEAQAQLTVTDPEGRELALRWQLMEESRATQSGGDPEETPPDFPGAVTAHRGEPTRSTLRVPDELGAYRLFAYATDADGSIAHANLPFLVVDADADSDNSLETP